MNGNVNWRNPYKKQGRYWLKGNLHTHTNVSDGLLSPEETIRVYERMGYGFLAITDHNRISSGDGIETDLVLLPGAELEQPHMGGYRHGSRKDHPQEERHTATADYAQHEQGQHRHPQSSRLAAS